MAERVRSHDWGATKLGPIDAWPHTLVSYVSLILELPTPAIIFWGADQIQIYNDGYAVIMGPRHPRYLGATYRECWPDTYPLIYPWMRNVLDRGEVVRVDNTLIPVTRYGFEEEAYFTFTFNPLRDDDGRIAGIYQPVVEVTEAVLGQRRTETLHMMAAANTGKDPLEQASSALAANPSDVPFAQVFEWDPEHEEVRLVARVGDSRGGELAAIAKRVAESGAPESLGKVYVVPLRTSQDEPRRGAVVFGVSPRLHFEERYRVFFDSAARQIASILATREAARAERRHADTLVELDRASKEAAQQERQRLYAAFMHAPAAFCLLTGEALVLELANHACLRAWGRDDNVIGMPLLEALPELRDQPFPSLLHGVMRTGEPVRQQRIVARLDVDGRGELQDVYFDFSYEPVRDPSGAVNSVAVFAVDVTHQVLAQREIESALEDARRANQAKDEFLAMLGHELRNPMAPIVTALDMMKLARDRDVSRERDVIERQTRQLVRLVDDLLDISRITRGAFELSRSRVGLDAIIERAVETAEPLFTARHHRLQIDVPRDLVVDGDADRLHQVFSNLLTNAAKYTPPRGNIGVIGRRDGDTAVIVVRDDGTGIGADMLPRVFEMFVQERQEIDRARGGLGLGLAIVHAIVRRHGGEVTARSAGKDKGSEFEVRLPLSTEAAITTGTDTGRSGRIPLAASRGRVLIVDDNADAAIMLADVVAAMGHDARVVHDGPSALEVASTFRPHVALLDIGLPVMDGYEVANRLRAQQFPIRLIALTGYGRDSDREQSKTAGFDAHMVKPVDLGQLAQALQRLIVTP